MGGDDGCARSDWSGVTKLPQEALLWRDASDLSAIDPSRPIDLSARLGGSIDFSVAERELGAPSFSIAGKYAVLTHVFSIAVQDLPEVVVTEEGEKHGRQISGKNGKQST